MNKRGIYTTDVIAAAKDGPAHEWGQQWGKGEPTLSWVAMRALAQTTSAHCSEQGWSKYDYIHSRRRNRLVQLASDLTKGHNMARLSRRFKKSRCEHKFHAHTMQGWPILKVLKKPSNTSSLYICVNLFRWGTSQPLPGLCKLSYLWTNSTNLLT